MFFISPHGERRREGWRIVMYGQFQGPPRPSGMIPDKRLATFLCKRMNAYYELVTFKVHPAGEYADPAVDYMEALPEIAGWREEYELARSRKAL